MCYSVQNKVEYMKNTNYLIIVIILLLVVILLLVGYDDYLKDFNKYLDRICS